jgi:hypothetical protein
MARTPQTPAAQTVLPVLPPVPGWARSAAAVTDSEPAFQAGAALAALDARVRADARAAPFAGAWRRRLALARRGEDEASLRDALLLRHAEQSSSRQATSRRPAGLGSSGRGTDEMKS